MKPTRGKHMRFIFTFLISLLISLPLHAATNTTIYAPIKIITNGSMAATLTSTAVDLIRTQQYSIQAAWTGSPVGSIQLNVSNDIGLCANASNWVTYTASIQPVNGAGNFLWNIGFANYNCVEVVYTFTSGSGTLNVIYGGK
jgi:hypothetical protein